MTEHSDPHSRFVEEEVVANVLRRARDEIAIPAEARDRVRRSTFAAHDDVVGAYSQNQGAEVIDLSEQVLRKDAKPFAQRLAWVGVAAACLVLVVGFVLLADSSENGDRVVPASDRGSPFFLDPGTHRSDVLGVGVEFTSGQALWVVREQPGLIELAVDPDDLTGSRLWLVGPANRAFAGEATSATDFFDQLPEGYGAQVQPAIVAGRKSTAWRIRASSGVDRTCEPDRSCVPFVVAPFEIGLVTERSTDVFERPLGDDFTQSLLLVSWVAPDDWALSYGAPFQDIIDSLEIDDS